MATIGHALVGLTLGEICPPKARDQKMPYVWFGLMVAAAFLVDFAEWIVLFFVPPDHDKHFFTHSPLYASLIAAGLVLVTALVTRMRSAWPYLLIILAVMSHLPLDLHEGRDLLASVYGFDPRSADYLEGAVAESWLFGLIFVIVTLILAIRDPQANSKFTTASVILIALSLAAAGTRIAWIWAPIYALALLHASLLWRKKFDRRFAWSLVPLIPLLVVPITQGIAGYLTNRAIYLRTDKGDPMAALELNEYVLNFPSRKSFVTNYLEISRCYDTLGKPAESEAALKSAVKAANSYSVHRPRFFLALFYMNRIWKGTPYYQPDKAAQILRRILDESSDPDERTWATGALDKLRQRNELPPPPTTSGIPP